MRSAGNCCVNADDLNACADLVRAGGPGSVSGRDGRPGGGAQGAVSALCLQRRSGARAVGDARGDDRRDAPAMVARRAGGNRAPAAPCGGTRWQRPLAEVLDAEGARLLDELIAARRWDIYRDPFEDAGGISGLSVEKTAGHLMWAAARALGAPAEAESVVLDAGYARGLAQLAACYSRAGSRRAGCLWWMDARGRTGVGAKRAGVRLTQGAAGAGCDPVARLSRPCCPAWKTAAILRRAVQIPAHVAEGTLDVSPMRSRLTLMARAATGRW